MFYFGSNVLFQLPKTYPSRPEDPCPTWLQLINKNCHAANGWAEGQRQDLDCVGRAAEREDRRDREGERGNVKTGWYVRAQESGWVWVSGSKDEI